MRAHRDRRLRDAEGGRQAGADRAEKGRRRRLSAPSVPPADAVDATAFWTAYCRAIEALRPDALVVDRYAAALCGAEGRAIGRALERRAPVGSAVVVRTGVIDDCLRRSFERDSVERVVLLGCGLDARALRLPSPPGLEWVELDRAPVLAWKEHRLAARSQPQVRRSAIDLGDRAMVDRAIEALPGRVVVVLEGVLQYLAPSAVSDLLRVLARRTAWTRVLCDVGGGRWSRWFAGRVSRAARDVGAPYRSQIDDAAHLFAEHGLHVVDRVSLVEWDAAQPRPRWRRPWSAAWVPGYADAACVVEAAPESQVDRGVAPGAMR